MEPTEHNQEPSYNKNRREFCKKVPCAAMGIMASSGILTSFAKGPTHSKNNKLLNEYIMANIITAKVTSQEGSCDNGHKVGDEIVFTETGVEGKICIHALYSFLPKVFAMMYDAQFPWLEDPDVSTASCPDAHNPVVFEISRKKKS